jgi:hypothetical protein
MKQPVQIVLVLPDAASNKRVRRAEPAHQIPHKSGQWPPGPQPIPDAEVRRHLDTARREIANSRPRWRRRSPACGAHVGMEELHHPPVELNCALARVLGQRESLDKHAGAFNLRRRGREHFLADVDLTRVDERLALIAPGPSRTKLLFVLFIWPPAGKTPSLGRPTPLAYLR